jgi:hypothetical protein
MEKFWAVILIFVIVAAGGLLYVNQVYNPQKETQMAMAETANQTLSAVKMEMGNDTTPSIVNVESVRSTVKMHCDTEGNIVEITVINGTGTKTYKNSSEGIDTQLEDETKMFLKKPKRDGSGKLESISFTYITD